MAVDSPGRLRIVDSSGNLQLDLNDASTYLLEWFDPGMPEREETWIHPDAGPSYLGRFIDRPVQAVMCLHILPQSTHATLRAAIRAVRNQLEFAGNYIEFGPSANDWLRYRTYPTAVPSPLGPDQLLGARPISQKRVLDWEVPVWRDPYPVAGRAGGSTSTQDVQHLPML